MKNQKPSDLLSRPISLLPTDEMDVSGSFDNFYSKILNIEEISDIPESSITKNTSDLDLRESQQKIPTSETLDSQLTLDPEISSILARYPHYDRPPDLLKEVPFGTEVYSYPPMLGLDENERLHCLDEYFEYDLPDMLETCPTTPTVVENESLSCPDADCVHGLGNLVINTPPETESHVGNSDKPKRRIDVCAKFLRCLKISDLPFTVDQRKSLVTIERRILGLYAKYSLEHELSLKTELDRLIDSFSDTDYPVSPTRINRYIAFLISELKIWRKRKPKNSKEIPFSVDPAVYFINKLLEVFPEATEKAIEKSFCIKRKEIHVKLVQLFYSSKFPFTRKQKSLFKELTVIVHTTTGNPESREEGVFVGILEKLLHDFHYLDKGSRDGISNAKKMRQEFKKFVDALIDLGQKERELLNDFEIFFLKPADLIYHIIEVLQNSFIPRHIL